MKQSTSQDAPNSEGLGHSSIAGAEGDAMVVERYWRRALVDRVDQVVPPSPSRSLPPPVAMESLQSAIMADSDHERPGGDVALMSESFGSGGGDSTTPHYYLTATNQTRATTTTGRGVSLSLCSP